MTYEQCKTLIPGESFVGYAGAKYRFSGMHPDDHFAHRIYAMIYDEPPSLHIDEIAIDNLEYIPPAG